MFYFTFYYTDIYSRKENLHCAIIDHEHTFDDIMRDAFWLELVNLGLSHKLITIVKSLYSKVSSCVRIVSSTGCRTSHSFDFGHGLKQGNPMLSLLFILYVKLLFVIQHFVGFHVLSFTDDMVTIF